MEKIYVFVYLPGEIEGTPAGMFSYDRNERAGSFLYGRKYLGRFNTSVSVDLPVGKTNYTTQKFDGLFAAFRDSQPDYWGRVVYASIYNKNIEELHEDELLVINGASRIGNLDFRKSLYSPEPSLSLPSFSSLDGLLNASENIQNGIEVDKAYRQLIVQGTTVGGMRPKCTIEDGNKLWIAKFPSITDTYNAVKVEAATMELARLSGIAIPDIRVEKISNKDVFLIERFDRRYDTQQKGYLRKGFISCLSFLEKDEFDRGFGYADFADSLRKKMDHHGAAELFKRMVFNISVRNIDDHARNHGVIFYDNDFNLSPAYDITPSISREGVSEEFDLAMNAGNFGRSATINNAMSCFERFGITDAEAIQSVNDVLQSLYQWRDIFKANHINDMDTELFSYTFESGIKKLKNVELILEQSPR